jgi:multicomponent Na+:H+ antiporter subunit E
MAPARARSTEARVTTFLACLAFWLALSGHRDPLHLALGAASAALVAALNRRDPALPGLLRRVPRLAAYSVWLLGQIVRSNLHVARIVLDPRLPVDPVVVRVPAPAGEDLAVALYANSITVTPGTVTLDVEDGELVVHALTPVSAAGVTSGEMGRRVARVFGAARG